MIASGKRILITGAGHGLGRAMAHEFGREAAEVIVTDRDPARVAHVVDEVKLTNGLAFGYQLDVTDTRSILAAREQILAERGPIDVLVNNAGIVHGGPFLQVPLEKQFATTEVNFHGLLLVTQIFLHDLIGRPEAHVVNISSAAALIPMPGASVYAAGKAAVLSFSDSLREELRGLGHRHVGVTAICPSLIDTGLFAGAKAPLLTSTAKPERVARAVVRGLRRKKRVVVVPWSVRLLHGFASRLPRSAFHWLCRLLGVSTIMKNWKGHPPAGA